MIDPHLCDLMHEKKSACEAKKASPVGAAEKNRYELALESKIKQDVELLLKEEDPTRSRLLTPALYRAKLEKERNESCDLTELSKQLSLAVQLLERDGKTYLDSLEYESVLTTFDQLRMMLVHVELDTLEKGLNEIFNLGKSVSSNVLQIAKAKYGEGLFHDSLSLFALLALFDGENGEYWYRLGLVAQKAELLDLAVRAYAAAASFMPHFIGIPIFTAECLINMGLFDAATVQLLKAKALLQKTTDGDGWAGLIADMEKMLS